MGTAGLGERARFLDRSQRLVTAALSAGDIGQPDQVRVTYERVRMSSVIQTATGLRILAAHLAPIRAIGASGTADGHGLILSAGGDDMIRSWDATTGVAGEFTLPCPSLVTSLGVVPAPDGHVVVCRTLKDVHRWDLASGQPIGEPIRSETWGYHIKSATVLDAGGSLMLVTGGLDGTLRRWDLFTGAEIGQPSAGHTGEVLSVGGMRLADGRVLIVSGGQDFTVRRWDAVTGEPVGEPMLGHRGPVVAVACVATRDGRDVAITQTAYGSIRRWDAGTGDRIGKPINSGGQGLSAGGIAVTPEGTVLLSVGRNGVLWRWDLTVDEPTGRVLPGTTVPVNAVGVVPSAGGRTLLVSGDEWGALRRWDPATGEPVGGPLVGHPASVTDLAAVPAPAGSGGRVLLVSSGRDGARCWDAGTGEPVGVPPYDPMPVSWGLAPAWLPDGRLLLASGVDTGIMRNDVLDGQGNDISEHLENITVWDVATGTLPDGTVFIAGAGYDGMVYRADAATGAELGPPLDSLEGQALAVAVATLPDGVVMVAGGGDDGRVLRWDAGTGRRIGSPLTGHETRVARLAFVSPPDGPVMLVSLDDAGELRRWDAASGVPIGEPVQVCGEEVGSLRLAVTHATPAPQLITVGDDDVVRRWDAGTGRLLHEVTEASSAAVLTLPGERTVLAVGAPDGSISIGPVPSDR